MRLLREGPQTESSSTSQPINNNNNTEVSPNQSNPVVPTNANPSNTTAQTDSTTSENDSTKNLALNNPCIACFKEERRLACIPCGHFTVCLACSSKIRTCPTCRRQIDAFVRIFI